MEKTRRLSGRLVLALGGLIVACMLAMGFGMQLAGQAEGVVPPPRAASAPL